MKNVDSIIAMLKKNKIETSDSYKRFVVLISMIPKGSVATYGQIAKLAGRPQQVRQVVWTLHSSSKKYKLPWHRVINSQGKIGLTNDQHFVKQRLLLLNEGIEFDLSNKINLKACLWKPNTPNLRKILKKL